MSIVTPKQLNGERMTKRARITGKKMIPDSYFTPYRKTKSKCVTHLDIKSVDKTGYQQSKKLI